MAFTLTILSCQYATLELECHDGATADLCGVPSELSHPLAKNNVEHATSAGHRRGGLEYTVFKIITNNSVKDMARISRKFRRVFRKRKFVVHPIPKYLRKLNYEMVMRGSMKRNKQGSNSSFKMQMDD